MLVFKKHRFIFIFMAVCLPVYLGLLAFLYSTGVYAIDTDTNNDRFFSLDDVYYVTRIYSSEIDGSLRIVKHPLFMVFGNIAARLGGIVFGDLSIPSSYVLIVLMQIMVQMLALVYLYKILREFYKLENRVIFILLSIYAFSVSALIYTLFAESYIFSGAALILSYYYFLKRNMAASVILGVVVTGITITNFAIWAVMAVLLTNGIRRKILTICITTTAFIAILALTPVGMIFFNNFLYVMGSSPKNYSDSFGLQEVALRSLYAFFGTTVFYVDTIRQSPFGEFPGKAISFVPGSNPFILAFMLLWIGLLAYSAVARYRSKLFYAPLAVLLFNILLHGVKQYGLKEAFLYSLHHFFAQILMLAAVFMPEEKSAPCTGGPLGNNESPAAVKRSRKLVFALLVIFFAAEMMLNLRGCTEFYAYILTL